MPRYGRFGNLEYLPYIRYMNKTCTVCNQTKELKDFDVKRSGKHGRAALCKVCRRLAIKKHYDENTSYYVAKASRNNAKSVEAFKAYKETLNCQDCNIPFKDQPYLCDFHHLKDKDFEVAKLARYGLKSIMKEVKKCVPLCANCHRRRHHQEHVV